MTVDELMERLVAIDESEFDVEIETPGREVWSGVVRRPLSSVEVSIDSGGRIVVLLRGGID